MYGLVVSLARNVLPPSQNGGIFFIDLTRMSDILNSKGLVKFNSVEEKCAYAYLVTGGDHDIEELIKRHTGADSVVLVGELFNIDKCDNLPKTRKQWVDFLFRPSSWLYNLR